MGAFLYEARDGSGRAVRGREIARDEAHLDQLLAARDLLLVSARPRETRRHRRRDDRLLVDFCYHLGTAVEAGIPLLEALRDLADEGRNPIAHELGELAAGVEAGRLLSEAMEALPNFFPEILPAVVAAGEETGTLDRVLHDLARYLEWREDLRRRIVGAATYPCIVLLGLVGLMILLLTVVVPTFLEVFVELGVPLPLPTRVMLALHQFTASWWIHILAGAGCTLIAAVMCLRWEPGRRRFDALQLKTPVVGSVVSMLEMSRLSHNLGLLHAAGLPMMRSLTLVAQIVQNRSIRDVVHEAREHVIGGESLSTALRRHDVLPPMVLRMISLGETTGRLEPSLEHVASYYDRELPALIDKTMAIFNTATVVILGCVVATIALSIFVPIYGMLGSLNA